MKVAGIIPARYASTRLPGKPLEMIGDTSLIMRVFNQCMKVKSLDVVIVATDDERIFNHVKSSGGQAVMTSSDHATGTERCREALGKLEGDFDFVINIQGDEPFINPSHIETLINSLSDKVEVGTLCMPVDDLKELDDPNIPKLIRDSEENVIYFSRALIPYNRDNTHSGHTYLKHIGIYAYRKDVLATIVKLPPSTIDMYEQLEQLRWLYNGFKIRAVEIPYEKTISVDTYSDLENARKML